MLIVVLYALVLPGQNTGTVTPQRSQTNQIQSRLSPTWDWDKYAHVTAVLALILTLTMTYVERRRQNRLLRIQRLVDAEDKYDDICKIRTDNPQFIRMAQQWQKPPEDLAKASNDEIGYQSYVEMTLGFIETYVYLTYSEKTFTKKLFKEFIEPMIWLEVSYNLNAFRTYSRSKSISALTCAYLTDMVARIDASNPAGHCGRSPLSELRGMEELEKIRSEVFRSL